MSTFEIVTPDGLDDLNSYMVSQRAVLDDESMNKLEDALKVNKTFDQSKMSYVLAVAKEYLERKKYSGTGKWFTEDSGFPISMLPMQKLFFDRTKTYRQVQFRASNRTSKTISGAYAVTCWLTGDYPDWWEGRVFDGVTRGWACGENGNIVRDGLQSDLMGPLGHFGTGMIPKDRIGQIRMKTRGAIDNILVANRWGDFSSLGFKSWEEELQAFAGVLLHFVWEDEEPPLLHHNESFMRLTTTEGVLINTVTPLKGLTPYLLNFEKSADLIGRATRTVALTEEEQKVFDLKPRSKVIIGASWMYDAPWLSEKAKQEALDDTPLHLREARMTGNPTMGSGSIYPVDLESLFVDDMDFQKIKGPHFKYINGIDVGWNKTAVAFLAIDPDTDTVYLYDEYYMGEQRPEVHAVSIKSKGLWVPNVMDPASRGRSQIDGNKLMTLYIQSGLQVQPANNAVEAGIMDVYTLMSAGKFKAVRQKTRNFQHEFAMYKRDIHGKIVKENDHLLDALRYGVVERHKAKQKPVTNQFGGGSGAKKYF